MSEEANEFARQRAASWRSFMEPSSDDWIAQALAPVARLAFANERLAPLMPFQSLNRLCFTRALHWRADTLDCPSVCVARDGTYGVDRRAYAIEGADDPYGFIGDYKDPVEAVAALAAAVPDVR